MVITDLLLFLFNIISIVIAVKRVSSATILDCTRPNAQGLYGRGCSSKFMRCYNGKRYDYTCPKNLKFNVETAKCEHRKQVIACINNMDNDNVIIKADEPFDCSMRKDGVYGSGKCSTTYYHCSRGHSSEMICPAGLYYNDKLKGCDDIDSVDECDVLTALRGYDKRRESHLGEEGKYIERNLRAGTGGYVGGTRILSLGKAKKSKERQRSKKRRTRQTLYQANLWIPKEKLNCTGMKDGDYALVHGQCSKHFWRCLDGETTGRTCRGDELYFNSITGKCDKASNIMDCKEIADEYNQMLKEDDMEPDCSILNDGPFEYSPCSVLYYSCEAGQLLKLKCPGSQVYDGLRSRCDEPEFVFGCATIGVASSPNDDSPSEKSAIISTPELTSYCAAKSDGLYSAGCKNYFYFCASGNGHRINCPNGLFFESETQTCDLKERVIQCNISSATANGQKRNDNSTVELADRNAEKQEDENKEIRKESTIRVRATHIPEASISALLGIPLPRADDPPFLPHDFDCKSKADGLYSIGCKTQYVTCVNKKMFFLECPNKLIFDEETQSCDFIENIPECSKVLFKMMNTDEKEPPLRKSPSPARKISPKKGFNRIEEKSIKTPGYCKHLNDGIYFENCNRDYVICTRHTELYFSCPEGEIIDPVSKTCDELANVQECDDRYEMNNDRT